MKNTAISTLVSKEDLMFMHESYLHDLTIKRLSDNLIQLHQKATIESVTYLANGEVEMNYGIGFLITKYMIMREIFIYKHRAYPLLFKYDINDDMGLTKNEIEVIKKQLLINCIVPEI